MFTIVLLGLVVAYAALAAAAAWVHRRPDGYGAHSGSYHGSHTGSHPVSDRDPKRGPSEAGHASQRTEPSFVSVLVAARDEQERLPDCIRSLKAQSLASDRYEIIVADDHSTDGTPDVAVSYDVRCVRVPEAEAGKAAAIHAGVEAARGDVLVVTDADCRPPARWLEEMSHMFRDDDLGMVCGVTAVAGRSVIARIQAADWTLLLTMAAAFSAAGIPLTAMGNNMAFRRESYEAVGGYPAIEPSVTEDYALFREIGRRTPWSVRLLLDRRLRNVTLPLRRLPEVIRQRRRWARGGLRASIGVYLFYLLVYAVHAGIVVGLFVSPLWGLGALIAKAAADALVVYVGGRRIGQRHLRWTFPLFELYLFAYVLALPVLLVLAPRIRWRGRRW